MKYKMKVGLKKQSFILRPIVKLVVKISEWQYSIFFPLRWIGKLLALPIYFLLKDNYYKLLLFAQKTNEPTSQMSSRFLPDTFFLKVINGNKSALVDDYLRLLTKIHFNPDMQFEWARRFMEVGRLDLARVGFLELISRRYDKLPLEKQLQVFRHVGAVCFMTGKNSEANYYWKSAGQLRRVLFNPTTPKKYRILGPAWFAAIGHVAMLDYYLKFKQLYSDPGQRIVAQWDIDYLPGKDLIDKFAKFGIAIIHPNDLENDYNRWAKKHNAHKWAQLSPAERAALVDDFWEYDFPDGEILGYAHAAARIQKEWEQIGYPPLLSLSEGEKQWIAAYLANLGMPKDAWYVCLHVRESGFHKQWNSIYPSMRDAKIEDYGQAIEKIVNAGGWVLRMGDPSMKPLPPMRNVIDYAHNLFKTPMADILLVAGCRFLLGTNSGFATISAIYNVPCALTNWVPIGWPLWPSKDLMIPKLFREKESGRYLSLEELFKSGLAYVQNCSDLPAGIELVANTPEELAGITSEMLSHCNVRHDKQLIKPGAPADVEEYYIRTAKRYGTFTGSRLARTIVEKHPEIFTPIETESTETSRGNNIEWHVQSNGNMTATLN